MVMSEEAQKAKREYMREYMRKWRKNNKEKIKANQERHWLKKAKEMQGKEE